MRTVELALSRALGRDCGCAKRRARLKGWMESAKQWIITLFMSIETLWVRDAGTWKPVFDLSVPDPCASAPTITGHTRTFISAPTCSPQSPWENRSDVTHGTLGTFQIERQFTTAADGTSGWTNMGTSQNSQVVRGTHEGLNGEDGPGPNENIHIRFRARIVTNIGEPCGDWVNSAQATESRPSCTL